MSSIARCRLGHSLILITLIGGTQVPTGQLTNEMAEVLQLGACTSCPPPIDLNTPVLSLAFAYEPLVKHRYCPCLSPIPDCSSYSRLFSLYLLHMSSIPSTILHLCVNPISPDKK
jgi:hypothetical protein